MAITSDIASGVADPHGPLLRGMLARDQSALAKLYDLTCDRVNAVALRVLGNAHDAEEVVVDTFQQAWNRAAQYEAGRGTVLRWLLVIAQTRALDLRRRLRDRARTQPLHPDDDDPAYTAREDRTVADLLDAVAGGTAVHAALASLTAQQRRLVELAFLREQSHQEIAEAEGLPLGTVKSHIRRGLIALRAALKEKGLDDGGT
ncbi:MAG TPA: sigma-70 family RNA polymerase sigma factor [Xanthomonadales bacterium]|nr:sigma-70 family RNA polymerase sigma factor [Xanthomonadales bacterium]